MLSPIFCFTLNILVGILRVFRINDSRCFIISMFRAQSFPLTLYYKSWLSLFSHPISILSLLRIIAVFTINFILLTDLFLLTLPSITWIFPRWLYVLTLLLFFWFNLPFFIHFSSLYLIYFSCHPLSLAVPLVSFLHICP